MKKFYTKYEFPIRKINNKELIELIKIEDKLKCKLPLDYAFFLENYSEHEIFINDQTVILWDLFDLIEINNDYLIFDDLSMVISIGSNGAGECIAIEFYSKNKHRIVLTPFIGYEKSNFIEIGSSFSNFLMRLDKGIDWFGEI